MKFVMVILFLTGFSTINTVLAIDIRVNTGSADLDNFMLADASATGKATPRDPSSLPPCQGLF